jgi:hypothetical protein
MFVGNWGELSLKQRRTVMGHVQAQRAMHAKKIFLKELATVGRRLNKTDQAEGVKSILGKRDPLKVKLENISF